jgi:hypothetical protein
MYIIPSIVLMAVVMSGTLISCGFSTGSSVPKQHLIDISEWIGDYHGTATFFVGKRPAGVEDSAWIENMRMDGKEQSIDIRIYQDRDNIRGGMEVHIELHMGDSSSDKHFYLNPSQLSANTIKGSMIRHYVRANGVQYPIQYNISLTREKTRITGTLTTGSWSGGSWYSRYSEEYRLNLEKRRRGKNETTGFLHITI